LSNDEYLGVALLRAVEALKRVKGANDDQKHGIENVRELWCAIHAA
jgi:hypothetical protein